MRILLATHSFSHIGGSETYLLTVAEHLQRLGHSVTIHAANLGPVAELAIARGLPVAAEDDELPATCDVVLVQDAGMAHLLAERFPRTPQVLRAPSDIHDFQLPPMTPGTTRTVVVTNDRVALRIRSLDPEYPVVRLRQPIDTERLMPLGTPRERPRVALLLGNYQEDQRRSLLEDAWGDQGVELRVIGARGRTVLEPYAEIAEADIVVAKGRAALDAMSCARPTYVFDDFGTDGWVTGETYAAIEADGFAGQALDLVVDRARLEDDLQAYDAAMGVTNRDLVLLHHKARDHAHELVGVFRSLAPGASPSSTAGGELARNVRLRWAADLELAQLRSLYGDLEQRVRESEARATAAEAAAAEAGERAAQAEQRAALDADRAAAADRALAAARAELGTVLTQRRVRAGRAFGRAADLLRSVTRRGRRGS